MKSRMSAKGVSALIAAGALAISGVAMGSSAFAADPTPTPTVSAPSIGGTLDSEVSVDASVQGLIGDDREVADFLDTALASVNADVNAQAGSELAMENDDEVDAVNADNQDEQASFNEDISAADQAGDSEDAAQLSTDASIVASVTAPVAQAMASDDAQAHAIIVGAPLK
jgi:hypothetical protein